MAGRRYIFIHEIISTEEEKLLEKMKKLPVDGRRTKPQTIKQVRQLINDASFQIARKYNVLVNYPCMTIQGKEVVLGKASILLPSGRFVDWDELRVMELERENKYSTGKSQIQKNCRKAERRW